MFRYFAIATVLVVGTLIAATAYHEFGVRIAVGKGKGSVAPPAAALSQVGAGREHGLRGDAPWALSALPECMLQVQEWEGTLSYVRAHLPNDAQRILPPETLYYADCTIDVTDSEVFVTRGPDRLRIPPNAQLYQLAGRGLALVRAPHCVRPSCAAVLRIYATPAPKFKT